MVNIGDRRGTAKAPGIRTATFATILFKALTLSVVGARNNLVVAVGELPKVRASGARLDALLGFFFNDFYSAIASSPFAHWCYLSTKVALGRCCR